MPTIYQDRCGVSLYDAQYSTGKKGPIPQGVIEEVLAALMRFRRTCQDFGVRDDAVRIVATEATRNAINSQEFQQQIQTKIGWKVELLAKDEEGRVGAMGIASSFQSIKGLVLDLGGGSVQITWIISENGNVQTSPKGSVSFPYGAAALMMRLKEVGSEGKTSLQRELATNFGKALEDLEIPQSLLDAANEEGGFTLYLSGGGFRGWGYILMSLHNIQPYPIPIINGFCVPKSSFLPPINELSTKEATFRISSRRASQVPAISLIIEALTQAIPSMSKIRFAQGGVREGLLFSQLPADIRAQHPLITATLPYAPPSASSLVQLLRSAIPEASDSESPSAPLLSLAFLTSTIHLLNAHSSLPKDIRAAAALRSTTTGLLSNAHGLIHEDRALLALILWERWGGEISPTDIDFMAKMQEFVGLEATWWAKYAGRIAQGIGEIFPAGLIRKEEENTTIEIIATRQVVEKGKRYGDEVLQVRIRMLRDGIEEAVREMGVGLEKLGKKKHRGAGKEGWGMRVEVIID